MTCENQNQKNEVLDAKFGSLNKIFGNYSCLNGFRCLNFLQNKKFKLFDNQGVMWVEKWGKN